MAAALVLRPVYQDRMQVHSFKGDQDHLLDKLIAASQRKEVPVESLKERPLVPFFESSDASATVCQALQPGRRAMPTATSKPVVVPPHHGLKRHAHDRSSTHLSGSPPKKEAEVVQAKHQRRGYKQAASAASSGSKGSAASASVASSPTDYEATSARKPRPIASKKHQREAAAARVVQAPSAPSGSSQRQSPPRNRPEHGSLDMRQLAAASAAAASSLRTPGKGAKVQPAVPSKFAGPAFTNSPTPDSLPIPTSSLLLQEAADSLRFRLTL